MSDTNVKFVAINGVDTNGNGVDASTGNLLLQTGGVERARIDTSGNVGIGGVPSYPLDVVLNANSAQRIRVRNSNSGSSAQSMVHIANDANNALQLGVVSSTNATPNLGFVQMNAGPMLVNVGGANYFAVNTNSGERMRIDSSGNVGIGKTPTTLLDVNGTVTATAFSGPLTGNVTGSASLNVLKAGDTMTGALTVQKSAGSAFINLNDTVENWAASLTTTGSTSTFELTNGTTSPIIRVLRNGNIGIGMTPTQKLDVSGIIQSSSAVYFGGGVGKLNFSGSDAYIDATGALILRTSGTTERMRIDTSGNVGVGVTPSAKFHVSGTNAIVHQSLTSLPSAADQRLGMLSFGSEGETSVFGQARISAFSSAAWTAGTTAPSYLSFSTTPSASVTPVERMRITSAGNLLVGTTAPLSGELVNITSTSAGAVTIPLRLHNASTTTGSGGTLSFTALTNSGAAVNLAQVTGVATNATGSGALLLITTAGEVMRLDASGNVGIGTTPNASYKLHTASTGANNVASQGTTDASFINVVNGTQALYMHSTSASSEINELRAVPLLFTVNSAERMRIDSSGNLMLGSAAGVSKFTIQRGTGAAAPTTISAANTYITMGYSEFNTNSYRLMGLGYYGGGTHYPAYMGYQEIASSASTYGDLVFFTRSVTTDTQPSERMRIDNAGNVGIGGTPLAKLHVTASTDNSALVETTGTSSSAFLQLKSGSGTTSARYSYVSYLSNETTPQEWRSGMYSNVNFVIRDHTAASNRLIIDTNGNVGVGAASPQAKLHVQGTSSTAIVVDGSGTTTGAINTGSLIQFWGHDGVGQYAWGGVGGYKENGTSGNQASYLSFSTRANGGNLTEQVRVTSSGTLQLSAITARLLIQPATGTNNAFLQFNNTAGNAYVGLDSLGGSVDVPYALTLWHTGAYPIVIGTNNAERVRIDSSGNFLVGTTTANYSAANRGLIEVNGSTDSLIAFKRGGTSKGYLQAVSDDGLLLANVTSTGYIAFNTNAAERLRIDANGNLAVNVTPNAWHTSARALQMSSGGALWNYSNTQMNLSQGLYYDAAGFKYLNTGVAASTISMNSGAFYIQQAVSGTAGAAPTLTTPFQIDASGNVGVGVTPTVKLDVNGNMRLGAAAVLSNSSSYLAIQSAGELVLDSAAAGGDISFRINSSEKARLDASGNLVMTSSGGIGYGTGSGGTVTQATSRTTGVTLNKTNGAITLFTAAGSATPATFTVTNSTVAATDVVHVTVKSATNVYATFVTATASGSFNVTFYALSGTASDAPVFNFAVIKAVTA